MFPTLKGSGNFPIDHAGGGGSQSPFVHTYGALNLSNTASGILWGFQSEAGALGDASESVARVIMPSNGGVLKYISFMFRTSTIAVPSTWTVRLDGADSALAVTVAAGVLIGSAYVDVAVAGNVRIGIRYTTVGLPGSATTRPTVTIGGYAL